MDYNDSYKYRAKCYFKCDKNKDKCLKNEQRLEEPILKSFIKKFDGIFAFVLGIQKNGAYVSDIYKEGKCNIEDGIITKNKADCCERKSTATFKSLSVLLFGLLIMFLMFLGSFMYYFLLKYNKG